MSKRIANTKENTARFGRIRIGWRKRRMLSQIEKMEELDRMEKLKEKAKQKFETLKAKAMKIIPKKLLLRHQGR